MSLAARLEPSRKGRKGDAKGAKVASILEGVRACAAEAPPPHRDEEGREAEGRPHGGPMSPTPPDHTQTSDEPS
jgi:hypothetical protein